jgi:CRP-like cAMP-binding protein
MHEALFRYFAKYTSQPLTEMEKQIIITQFGPKRLRKRQYFLQEGEICRQTAFIVKGAMRGYSVGDKGEEHIIDLFLENWWAIDRESVITKTPTAYFIDAWEDTDALVGKADFTNLIQQIPSLDEWVKKLSERHDLALRKRLNAAINMSAEQRYAELEKMYPEFLQRFPQHIIASYLGINKVTLSRIRGQASKK